LTQGDPDLLARTAAYLRDDCGWSVSAHGAKDGGATTCMVTSGTSGALTLAFLALLDPGTECIIPDPYFVSYPHLATMAGAVPVACDTYPDFRLTAERVEPLITDKTRFVLLNSPSNPAGVVLTKKDCADLLDLCRSRGVLLIADEIYDEFCYPEAATDAMVGDPKRARCPSPARVRGAEESVLLIRGFGKTYGVTGWRLGYVAGPRAVVSEMAKLQQYTFVCAPSALQRGAIACFDADMGPHVAEYKRRRELVVERLSEVTEVATPGGAFYAFFRVPTRMGLTGTQFVERAIERQVLTIPGACFSRRDTHVRLSFATSMRNLERGLEVLVDMMRA
ncbi:MAG: pyridoxal phosphate-dependent aminotransferase, partial [Phycisphaerales bacterium]